MNPQQPDQNPYNFILTSPKAAPNKPYLPKTNSKKGRIVVIGALVVVLLFGFMIVSALLNKPNPNTTNLLSLAQTQHELNRVATAGLQQLSNQGLRNNAATVGLTVLTHQNKTVSYLTSQKLKVTVAELGLKKNNATDTQLTTASQDNTYDTAFGQIMQRQLVSYATTLSTDYNKVTGPNAKAILRQQFSDTKMLLAQLNAYLAINSTTQ